MKIYMTIIVSVISCCTIQAQDQLDQRKLSQKETYKESDMYYTPKSAEAQTFYYKGHEFFNNNDFSQAISSYKQALSIEPGFIDAMDNLGNSYRYSGMNDSARYWYTKSINLYPKGVIAHQNLGIIYQAEEKYKEALNEYQIINELEPGNPEGFFGKANVYISLGKPADAITNAKKALDLYKQKQDPYEADALFIIGLGYYLLKDNKSAATYLKQAKNMGKEIPEGLLPLVN